MMINQATLIDISFLKYCLQTKQTRELALYAWLRMHYRNGVVQMSEFCNDQIAKDLGYKASRSINNQLDNLIELGWVTVNSPSQIYRLTALKRICKRKKLKRGESVLIMKKHLTEPIGVASAALIAFQFKRQGYQSTGRKVVQNSRGMAKPLYDHTSAIVTLPFPYFKYTDNFLAKVVNISKSTANAYKKRAEKSKLIRRYKVADPEFGAIPITDRKFFIQAFPELKHLLAYDRNSKTYYVRKADLIIPSINVFHRKFMD